VTLITMAPLTLRRQNTGSANILRVYVNNGNSTFKAGYVSLRPARVGILVLLPGVINNNEGALDLAMDGNPDGNWLTQC